MKAIIFDLDGTLLDSLKDIALCMNQVLEEYSYPTHEISAYNYFVGDGALILTQNALPKHATQEEIDSVLARFKVVYDLGVHKHTKPYVGILELLQNIDESSLKIGVLSNKPHKFTLKYVEEFFSGFNIQEIHGQKEGIAKKPDPTAALAIAKNFQIDPKDIVYVGDTATDIKTAKNAGFKSIGVLWGFRTLEELVSNGADYIAKEPSDIWDIIQSHQS